MAGRQGVVIQSTMSPQTVGSGSLIITIDKEMLQEAGISPDDPPAELTEQYHKGGSRDGELVIDLKEAVDGD